MIITKLPIVLLIEMSLNLRRWFQGFLGCDLFFMRLIVDFPLCREDQPVNHQEYHAQKSAGIDQLSC